MKFKFLGLVLCKQGHMEGDIRGKAFQGREFVRYLECIMKDRTVNMEIRALHNNIRMSTLTLPSQT